jgi:hypothetical protein
MDHFCFCRLHIMKAHLNPDWSNCEFILATRRPVFSLVLRVIFPELLTSGQLYYSDVMIIFDLYIIFASAHVMKQEISNGRNYFCFKYDKTDNSYPALIGKVTLQYKFYVCGVLLFVRIEQNIKICNTLHLVFFKGYTYKI